MSIVVDDVMSKKVVAVRQDADFADIVEALRRFGVGAVPVVDLSGLVVGLVCEDDLLLRETDPDNGEPTIFQGRRRRREEHRTASGQVARELMTSPALTVTRDTPLRDAARLMHRSRYKQLPVVDAETGRLTGMVHQSDLLRVFVRSAIDITRDVRDQLSAGASAMDPRGVVVTVHRGVVTLRGRVAHRSAVPDLVAAVRAVDGVVDVEEHFTAEVEAEAEAEEDTHVPPLYT